MYLSLNADFENAFNLLLAMYTKGMMKIIRTFNFKSKDFFDYLEQALTKQIRKNRKNKLPVKIGNGTIYTVRGKKQMETKVKIHRFDRNRLYRATFETMGEIMTVNYAVQDTDQGCRIVLIEDIQSYHPSEHHKLTNLFSSFMYHRSAEQELNKLADGIEKMKHEKKEAH